MKRTGMQLRHLLCPIDFSTTSQRALACASAIAERYGASLTVLHVAVDLPAMGLPPPSLAADVRDGLYEELQRWRALVPASVPLELALVDGTDVHRAILDQARERAADLLVIGSHGRSGIERFLLGSVAEKVMRKAPCPVLIVPSHAPDAAQEDQVQARHLVCPVDFSDGAAAALRVAAGLARDARATLTVLHVTEVPPELAENALGDWLDADRLRADVAADRRMRLDALVTAVTQATPGIGPQVSERTSAAPGFTMETVLREGVAYREILDVASARAADLIVMGEQGRGAVDRLVFGSNTARVVRAAACPVLIVQGA